MFEALASLALGGELTIEYVVCKSATIVQVQLLLQKALLREAARWPHWSPSHPPYLLSIHPLPQATGSTGLTEKVYNVHAMCQYYTCNYVTAYEMFKFVTGTIAHQMGSIGRRDDIVPTSTASSCGSWRLFLRRLTILMCSRGRSWRVVWT